MHLRVAITRRVAGDTAAAAAHAADRATGKLAGWCGSGVQRGRHLVVPPNCDQASALCPLAGCGLTNGLTGTSPLQLRRAVGDVRSSCRRPRRPRRTSAHRSVCDHDHGRCQLCSLGCLHALKPASATMIHVLPLVFGRHPMCRGNRPRRQQHRHSGRTNVCAARGTHRHSGQARAHGRRVRVPPRCARMLSVLPTEHAHAACVHVCMCACMHRDGHGQHGPAKRVSVPASSPTCMRGTPACDGAHAVVEHGACRRSKVCLLLLTLLTWPVRPCNAHGCARHDTCHPSATRVATTDAARARDAQHQAEKQELLRTIATQVNDQVCGTACPSANPASLN